MGAVVTLLGSATFNTTSGTKTVTATPAVGDLIVIIAAHSGSTVDTAPTDDNSSGTYTRINGALKATSVDKLNVFIRDTLIGSASSTVFTHAPGTTTGGGLAVLKVTGMTMAGLAAVVQSAVQANQAAAGTPTPTFGAAPNTVNAILGAVFNATNPATMTPRTNFTELADVGYATPTSGLEVMSRNSGETVAAQAWGGTSASAFASLVVELSIFAPDQKRFRFYNDDSPLNSSTAAAAENTNLTISDGGGDKSYQLNIQVQNTTAFGGVSTDDYQLQYSKNSGAWANVTTTSSNVKAFDSSFLTDAQQTSPGAAKLTAGTGSADSGEISETGLVTDRAIGASNYVELVYTVQTVDADLAGGDTLDFRLLCNGFAMAAFTVTPRITNQSAPISGVSTPTLGALTLAAAALLALAGDSSLTLDSLTASADGSAQIAGDASPSLGAMSVVADGSVAIAADAAPVLGSLNSSGDGSLAIAGDASSTLSELTVAADGTAAIVITGDAAPTLGALTAAADGSVAISGDSAPIFDPLASSGAGSLAISGDGAPILGALTMASDGGASPAVADASVTFGSLTASADGSLAILGDAAPTLGAVTAAADGSLVVGGSAAVTLADLTPSTGGTLAIAGTMSKTLGALTASAAATLVSPDFTFNIRTIQWSHDVPGANQVSGWTGSRTAVVDPWRAKWRASVELSPMTQDRALVSRAFLASRKGAILPFRLPATEGIQNGNSGVTVGSTAAQGAAAMTISGAATAMKDGQFVTVNSQLLCCTADQSGSTINFRPGLRQAASAGTAVETANPYALVYLASSQIGWRVEPGRITNISFSVEECFLEADPTGS